MKFETLTFLFIPTYAVYFAQITYLSGFRPEEYYNDKDISKLDKAFYERTILNDDFWKLKSTKGILNSGKEINYANRL
tara:strand:- start:312 stop:545 length:234 start_codon:yes stop_codon:yes gene_type:complete